MQLMPDMGVDFTARSASVEKIGEGQFRQVFRWDPFAIKILKQVLMKRQFCGLVHRPLQPYVREKYGIVDFNQHEFEHYRQLAEILPRHLQACFNPIRWAGHYQGLSISLSDLVLNDDGTPARPLAQSGVVGNSGFWNTLGEIENFLLDSKMFFTGVNSDNILVHKTARGVEPIVVDYKWRGREAYPCQFWLHSCNCLKKKMRNRFHMMRAEHKPFCD